MATTYNAKGTSNPSFTIGKKGVTIYQGTVVPDDVIGIRGDLYVHTTANQLFQKGPISWARIGGEISEITSGNTGVRANPNSVVVTVEGDKIVDVLNNTASLNLEHLTIQNGASKVVFATHDNSGTNSVDLELQVQGDGVFRVVTNQNDSFITNDNGNSLRINPANKTSGPAGDLILRGGNTGDSSTAGNVVLVPGTNTSGMGQVLAHASYIPGFVNSLVTKGYVDSSFGAQALATGSIATVGAFVRVNIDPTLFIGIAHVGSQAVVQIGSVGSGSSATLDSQISILGTSSVSMQDFTNGMVPASGTVDLATTTIDSATQFCGNVKVDSGIYNVNITLHANNTVIVSTRKL